MSRDCRKLQERIAAEGTATLRADEAAQRHLAECEECFAFIEAFSAVGAGLAELPALDAPDDVVAALLERVRSEPTVAGIEPEPAAERWFGRARRFLRFPVRPRYLAWGSATVAVLLLALVVGNWPTTERPRREAVVVSASGYAADEFRRSAPANRPPPAGEPAVDEKEALRGLGYVGDRLERRALPPPTPDEAEPQVANVIDAEAFSDEFLTDLPVPGRFYQNVLTPSPGVADEDQGASPNVHGSRSRDFEATASGVSDVNPLTGQLTSRVNSAARAFLAERANLQGLTYQDPTGYWSNTYVPGDPVVRLLQARLRRSDRSALEAFVAKPLRLHDAAYPVGQPFDAPENAAIGVYMHADRAGIEGQGRMLVQVGLQATERHGGRRPAMNLALVLDLRGEVSDAVATGIRAVVTAVGQARDLGDRFSLVVAGDRGGLVVGPDDFRHGYLSLTLDRLLAGNDLLEGSALGLADALETAIATVVADDDPTSPLGTSAVVLITGQPFGGATDSLAELAHKSAVGGIPVSAVAVGPGVATDEIDRVTLYGQGRRRVLDAPAEATSLVDRELAAAGRAVARAVRLRIRLAPGVKLVDVLGSERLDERRAERVRQAEQSIDRRLARNLGIEADRGEDEEGIQIVIPSFYAGDAHVILLDVTAAGPGPIADATVRYKDLVYLRNGVARASLSVDREMREPGPLEHNVLANLLSRRLASRLEDAGEYLAADDAESAAQVLGEMRDLLHGLGHELPRFDADVDPTADLEMLNEYIALVTSGATTTYALRAQLSDSLRYAGRLKMAPPPALN